MPGGIILKDADLIIQSSGSLRVADNIYVGDSKEVDHYLRWTKVVDETPYYETIHFDWTNTRFEFSDDIYVGGNIEGNSIVGSSNLISNGNIYVNNDGPDGDSYIYFYDGGSSTGAYILYEDAVSQFTLNKGIYAAGHSVIGGDLRIHDRIFVNSNGPEGNAYIFFYEGGAEDGAYLRWDNDLGRFKVNQNFSIESTNSRLSLGSTSQRDYQIHVRGAGQATGNYNESGSHGASIHLSDTGYAASSGGSILFGGTGNEHFFAGIKGKLTDGGNYTLGDLGIFLRTSSTSTNCTELFRFKNTGALLMMGNHFYLNYDGAAADTFIYSYTSASSTGTHLKWDEASARWEFNHKLWVNGAIEQLWGNVLVVSKDGRGDYSTVAAACSAASSGDVILVMPGTYTETSNCNLPAGVSLIGVNRDLCIINTTSAITLLTFTGDNPANEYYVANLTFDHDNATGNTVIVNGTSVTSKYEKVYFENCKILGTQVTTAGLSITGGYVVARNCLFEVDDEYAVSVSAGAGPYAGTFEAYNCNIYCGTYASVITSAASSQAVLQNCYVWADNFEPIASSSGGILMDGCRIQGVNSHAAARVIDGTTEGRCRFVNCHLISTDTNLINLTSGTATIGMYNCTINNDTKPVNLTVTSGVAATNYGGTNIKR